MNGITCSQAGDIDQPPLWDPWQDKKDSISSYQTAFLNQNIS